MPDARLWAEFVQMGQINPPELRDYPPYNYSYLCVRILDAGNLPPADANGLADPFFTLEWAGQVLTSSIKPETLSPVYNETMFFHIP